MVDGLGAAGKNSDVRKVEFEGDCKAAAKKFALKRCLPYGLIKGNRHYPGKLKVIPVVVVVISSLTVGEVTIRVIWVGRMVSSDGPGERLKIFCVCLN